MHRDIAKLVSLSRRLESTPPDGDEANLKDQILTVLHRLFARLGQDQEELRLVRGQRHSGTRKLTMVPTISQL